MLPGPTVCRVVVFDKPISAIQSAIICNSMFKCWLCNVPNAVSCLWMWLFFKSAKKKTVKTDKRLGLHDFDQTPNCDYLILTDIVIGFATLHVLVYIFYCLTSWYSRIVFSTHFCLLFTLKLYTSLYFAAILPMRPKKISKRGAVFK